MTYDHWKTTEPDMHDETPQQWFTCDLCDGMGVIGRRVTVYEHGCGFPHDDTEENTCINCGGVGGWVVDAEPDRY